MQYTNNDHPYKYMNIRTGEVFENEEEVTDTDDIDDVEPIDIMMIDLIKAIIKTDDCISTACCQGEIEFGYNKDESDLPYIKVFGNPYVLIKIKDYHTILTRLLKHPSINISIEALVDDPNGYKYILNISMSEYLSRKIFDMDNDDYGDDWFGKEQEITGQFNIYRDEFISTLYKFFK